MCGRVRLSSDVSEIKQVFSIPPHRPTPNIAPSWNVAPTDPVPVVRYDTKAGERSLDVMRWGLVPFWAKDIKVGFSNINAKAEGIEAKPAFREAFQRRRCLVPLDNFYEWKKTAAGKQPYAIALADQRLMALAGLWETWRSPAGERVRSFAIITTTPNELCAELHNRMPVILKPDMWPWARSRRTRRSSRRCSRHIVRGDDVLARQYQGRKRQEQRAEPDRAHGARGMMPASRRPERLLSVCLFLAVALTAPHPSFAWGDQGHEIVALIAEHYVDPGVRAKIALLLAADTDSLTDHDIASEATWADKYRDSDSDTIRIRYEATRRWHFVDIELAETNLASACFGHPSLPPGALASKGPPRACVVDKIDQFVAELSNPATATSEQLLALKFLLHFVGDLRQPLHAADDHDAGGNKKLVAAEGLHSGNLHGYWDIEFVERLGTDPRQVAERLIGQISETQQREWSRGKPTDWAMEAFALARGDAYGLLPATPDQGTYTLPAAYIERAVKDVALQLSRAGVRLAFVLNYAFTAPP